MDSVACLHSSPECTDQALVTAYLDGDEDAFEALVQRYQNRLVGYLNNLVRDYDQAVDLAQEAFIRVFRSAHRYQGRYPFSTWIYRIATNLAIDEMRRRKGKGRFFVRNVLKNGDGEEMSLPLPDLGESPLCGLERKEQARHLKTAIDSLPERYRYPFLLREIEDLSYQEASRVLQISLGTVKSRIHRAKMLLREKLAI